MAGPNILFLDIETAPMEVYCWGMFDQTISLNMVKQHTTMLSWAAKWKGKKRVYYQDVSKQKNIRDDKKICKSLQTLINQADIVVGHAINRFDKKKSNYRFIVNGLQPTKSCRVVDTLLVAKKHFAFDSNKLEHLADILKVDLKKYKHSKFAGFELWKGCLAGNPEAWKEMKKYNPVDVLVLELVYDALIPWDNSINFDVFRNDEQNICSCGHPAFMKYGYRFTNAGKFQRYKCRSCGKEHISKDNLLTKEKRKSLRK